MAGLVTEEAFYERVCTIAEVKPTATCATWRLEDALYDSLCYVALLAMFDEIGATLTEDQLTDIVSGGGDFAALYAFYISNWSEHLVGEP